MQDQGNERKWLEETLREFHEKGMERSCGETGEKHQAAHRVMVLSVHMEVLRAIFLSSLASVPSVAYTEIADCHQQYRPASPNVSNRTLAF